MKCNKNEWVALVLENIIVLSRTAKGEIPTDYAGKKPRLVITDPKKLQARVEENLRRAAVYAWDHVSKIPITRTALQTLINSVATEVSKGLLPPHQSLFRTWETSPTYPQQPSCGDLQTAYHNFCCELASGINNHSKDVVGLAAWAERQIDWGMHPFTDGCGRTAKLVGAWVLLHYAKSRPPQFPSRAEYYHAMNQGAAEWDRYYRRHVFGRK